MLAGDPLTTDPKKIVEIRVVETITEGRTAYRRDAAALYEEFTRRTGCALAVSPVPGDHLSMYEPPHVAALAAELERMS